ncbi:MAG: pyridoxal-dependent decarboxylase [bacterium]
MKSKNTRQDGGDAEHAVDPAFEARCQHVREHFFSRNPKYWPCFKDPGFSQIIEFRNRHLKPDHRLLSYNGGVGLRQQLMTQDRIPPGIQLPGGQPDGLLRFAAALSKDWENPASVENVITMPCDPAIYGAMMGLLANPNLVYTEYSGMADELEKNVVRQMASLAGYDVGQAAGLFTQGGTFCNLYGYLTGIRKSLPDAKRLGMGAGRDYRIMNSQGGHYSNITNLSLLGVDIEGRTIRIKINERNEIDLNDLEQHLRACFCLGCPVPAIMLTMGTTDTFAVDRVKPVYDLRNRLCEQYEVKVKPHIHVDSAIGWALLFFLSYDFDGNPLHINESTLGGLRRNVELFKELQFADSFTVDFQKWGYVPYTSSLVMFKDRDDLKALENDPENFSYFERDVQGQSHLQSTIECSRGAAGVFGAYAALNYMGIEGYQVAIANCLQNADYFRYRLGQFPNIKVVAPENQGPSVGFRIYDPAIVSDAEAAYDFEYQTSGSPEYLTWLQRNNDWHRQLFLQRGKVGLFTNWVEFVAHTAYDAKGRYHRLPGEKAVFLNPVTTRREIDLFINHLMS